MITSANYITSCLWSISVASCPILSVLSIMRWGILENRGPDLDLVLNVAGEGFLAPKFSVPG